MALVVSLAVGLLIILGVIFLIGKKYSGLYSNKHISEISKGLVGVKGAAIKSLLVDTQSINFEQLQENSLTTSGGLGLFYTIENREQDYRHHLSLSHDSGVLAVAAVVHFAAWLSFILEIPADKFEVRFVQPGEDSSVRHMQFSLSNEEQEKYAASPVKVLEPQQVKEAMPTFAEIRKTVQENNQLLLAREAIDEAIKRA